MYVFISCSRFEVFEGRIFFFPFVFVTIFIMVKSEQILGGYSVLIQTIRGEFTNAVFHNFIWNQLC